MFSSKLVCGSTIAMETTCSTRVLFYLVELCFNLLKSDTKFGKTEQKLNRKILSIVNLAIMLLPWQPGATV